MDSTVRGARDTTQQQLLTVLILAGIVALQSAFSMSAALWLRAPVEQVWVAIPAALLMITALYVLTRRTQSSVQSTVVASFISAAIFTVFCSTFATIIDIGFAVETGPITLTRMFYSVVLSGDAWVALLLSGLGAWLVGRVRGRSE